MATLHLSPATTVADLRKEFNAAFGAQIKVYNGGRVADLATTLAELGVKADVEVECPGNMTVAEFIERMKAEGGLKVKVYTVDEWVAVLDGLTLEMAGKVKKSAVKADMEKMLATKEPEDSEKKELVEADSVECRIVSNTYKIIKDSEGSFTVWKNGEKQENTKGALREIAKELDEEVDPNWNTRQLGAKMMKAAEEYNEGFDDFMANMLSNFAPKKDNNEQQKLEDIATLIICTTIAGDGSSTGAEIVAASKKAVEYGFDGDKLRETENEIWANKFVNAEELDLEAMARAAAQNLDGEKEAWQFIDICSEVLLVDQDNINDAAYILRVFGDEAGLSQLDIVEKLKKKLAGDQEAFEENEDEDPEDVMNDDEWEDVPNPDEVIIDGDVATISDGTVTLRDVDLSEAEECTKLIIPEGVKCICRGEIELENLESIEFPESLKVIEEEALDECPNLNVETLAAIKRIQENQIVRKGTTFKFIDPTDYLYDYDEVLDEFLDGKDYFETGEYVEDFDTDKLEQDCIDLIGKLEEGDIEEDEEMDGINLGQPGLYVEDIDRQLYTLVWRGEKVVSYH